MNFQSLEAVEEWLLAEIPVPDLNPSYVPIEPRRGVLHIRAGPHTGNVVTLSGNVTSRHLVAGLAEVDGETPLQTILDGFDGEEYAEVLAMFKLLYEKRIVYDATGGRRSALREYQSVSPYFSVDTANRLETATVGVIGGSIAEQVVRDLVDFGVEEVHYLTLSPAAADVESFGDSVLALRPTDLVTQFRSLDAVCLATSRPHPSLSERVNDAAHSSDTPWMTGQVQGFDCFVGPMVFPGETGCYQCFLARMQGGLEKPEMYEAFRAEHEGEIHHPQSPVLQPIERLVAGYVTLDLVNLLAFGQGFTAGRTIHINALDFTTGVNDVLQMPRCPVCGKTSGDDVSRFVDNFESLGVGGLGGSNSGKSLDARKTDEESE